MFNYSFHWRSAFKALPDMLGGAWVTLETAALSMILGVLIALLLTVMRQMKNPLLKGFADTWVSIARNTPSLFQIYILYFGLGSFGLHVSSWVALLAGITFNNAGYLAENFRGGLKAVPDTQMRAARSLGMSAFQAYRMIIVPQLLRIVYYPLTNQMVWAVLMTSLGVVVGLNNDLTGVTQDFNVRTFRTFEYFALAAVLYYIIAKVIVAVARLLSWRLFRY
ncbi:amino acid ABC transporter permease [Pseudomonas sp. BGr12]|jgi:amino acid ABC transporter membrane protein 1, PAAT family (TC 3.A.1.3.-)|uniref:Amino acid ABC transporter permease n=2 Tax=Pseudomonadaceae TaxID=135621 RepID=A0A5R9AIE3_PSENT|nr:MULTISPECIES: amino acid ABC transporter permease [Pseudomonadaceae]OQR34345.1 ABC transporter permease [Pseudomonas sp. T]KJJ96018.1 ABC transporter permease [Pseudomonas sp. 21]MBB4866954.1 polar amino acid transport system permease protein [Pseudomonas nitritireducens]MBD9504565.1 amino acid ABC transporter permease [Pseudomonas sp. PDM17]MBD9517778.1 amino acid ABC transporter permease [Pseudomonas sp. PDM22]